MFKVSTFEVIVKKAESKLGRVKTAFLVIMLDKDKYKVISLHLWKYKLIRDQKIDHMVNLFKHHLHIVFLLTTVC